MHALIEIQEMRISCVGSIKQQIEFNLRNGKRFKNRRDDRIDPTNQITMASI